MIYTQETNNGMSQLYNKYLIFNDCRHLVNILNKFSRVDAVLTSGTTSVVAEYKNRKNSVCTYYSCLFEKQKFEKLIEAGKLFDAPTFYIVEYDEAILIFDIQEGNKDKYVWETLSAPLSSTDLMKVNKLVTMLPYSFADFIISKKDWKRKTYGELANYIEVKTAKQLQELINN